ncbi:hypothetical protein ES708_34028 [subsurface metagenome]
MNVVLVHAISQGDDHIEDRSAVGGRGICHVEGWGLGSAGNDPEILEYRTPQILRPDLMRESTLKGQGVLHGVEPGLYRSLGGVELIDDGIEIVPLLELDLHPVDTDRRVVLHPVVQRFDGRVDLLAFRPEHEVAGETEIEGCHLVDLSPVAAIVPDVLYGGNHLRVPAALYPAGRNAEGFDLAAETGKDVVALPVHRIGYLHQFPKELVHLFRHVSYLLVVVDAVCPLNGQLADPLQNIEAGADIPLGQSHIAPNLGDIVDETPEPDNLRLITGGVSRSQRIVP